MRAVTVILLEGLFLVLGFAGEQVAALLVGAVYPGQHASRIIVLRAAQKYRGFGYAASAVLLVALAIRTLLL